MVGREFRPCAGRALCTTPDELIQLQTFLNITAYGGGKNKLVNIFYLRPNLLVRVAGPEMHGSGFLPDQNPQKIIDPDPIKFLTILSMKIQKNVITLFSAICILYLAS